MKANAPEKIFLSYETDEEGNIYPDYMWHRHRFEGMENIEYTRTDAFIEKIQKELDNLYHKWFDDSTGMEVSEEGAEIGALDMAYEAFLEIINSLKNKK